MKCFNVGDHLPHIKRGYFNSAMFVLLLLKVEIANGSSDEKRYSNGNDFSMYGCSVFPVSMLF